MTRPGRALPLALSAVVHVALIVAAGRVVWRGDTIDRPQPPQVVWLRPEAVAAVFPPRRRAEVPQEPVQRRRSTEPREQAAERLAESDAAERQDDADAVETEPQDKSHDVPSRRAVVRGEIDWDEERRRAVRRAGEQRRREAQYLTFSYDDIARASPSAEEQRPAESVFDSPAAGRAGITYYDPGMGQVRWVSDACYSWGGNPAGTAFAFPLSVAAANMPTVNCVRLIPRRDLFDSIERGYLDARPAESTAANEP